MWCGWKAFFASIAIFLYVPLVLSTIVIHELSGTDSAQLGSNTTAISCSYYYDNDTGVEIKWFYNDTVQIFQWIPDFNQPQSMGPFSDLLDVTNDTIHFRNMTKELIGNYTCKVSSNEDEQSRTEFLKPFQPASSIEFKIEELTDSLICAAYELYPLPVITVTGSYVSESNGTLSLQQDEDEIYETVEGFHNITRTLRYDKDHLKQSVEFVCNIYIPDTSYNETKVLLVEKDKSHESTTLYFKFEPKTTQPSEITSKESIAAVSTPSLLLLILFVISLRF